MKDIDITTLINRDNPLPSNYEPSDLYILDNNENNFHKYNDPNLKPMLSKRIKPYLDALISAALKDGYHIAPGSCYRSYAYQEQVLNALIKEKGDKAYRWSAYPGTSEHQSGLAMDFGYYRNGVFYDDVLKDDPEAIWMKNNSYKFGFILRYPEDKENITGFEFEPWHYRFVGIELATLLKESDITLDEYYQNLTKRKK